MLLPDTEQREFYFFPCMGDERARPIHLFSSTGPLAILVPRFGRGIFWCRHGKESENGTIRDTAGMPRARVPRFDFKAVFHAVFFLTLKHLLHSILNFRDDISGAPATRGLTTCDLNHRAGLAPMERVPRPSLSRTGFTVCGKSRFAECFSSTGTLACAVLLHLRPMHSQARLCYPTFSANGEACRVCLGNPKTRATSGSLSNPEHRRKHAQI